jgi:hypothetical protein
VQAREVCALVVTKRRLQPDEINLRGIDLDNFRTENVDHTSAVRYRDDGREFENPLASENITSHSRPAWVIG